MKRPIFRQNAVLLPRQRRFSRMSPRLFPRKDSQHKDSINTEATEYSKSGTDHASAQVEQAAFDPRITDPQQQKQVADQESGSASNPLEVSPANPDVSRSHDEAKSGAENSSASSGTASDRARSSGPGSVSKGKAV